MSELFTEEEMTGSADTIQSYREMLKLDPRSRVFTLLAEELCAAGQWEEAAAVCKKGLHFHPDHLRSRVLLGWALIEMGEVDKSERNLLKAVEDIRQNTIVFKLLSELASFSGNAQGAGEYDRIYQAFQTSGAVPPHLDPDGIEPVGPAKKEASEWDIFKAEAIEELHGPEVNTFCPEIVAEPTLEMAPQPKTDLSEILSHLVERLDERFAEKAQPAAILSEDDKNMLRQVILAELPAD
jgi:tetratricopeptide (TPR) repeat protein